MKVDILADLESLLYHYDEVQLPNLGVISTRQNDFSVDRGQGLIYPSAKKVHSFDRIINTNNNALVNFIAHKYGMSYDDAHQTIQDFADEHAETLTNKGLSIPSVGDLSIDENGRIVFQPNQLHNYSIENYGLPVLKNVHPVLFDRTQPKKEKKDDDVPTPRAIVPTKKLPLAPAKTYTTIFLENRLLQMMVIIALLLVTSIPLTKRYIENNDSNRAGITVPPTDITNNNSNTNTYDNNLPDNEGYKVTPNKEKKDKVVTPPKEEKAKEVTPKKETVQPPKKEENPVSEEDMHLIVLGAFGNKDNAEKLQLKIYSKGYKQANITKLSNGFYRVGILLDCPKSEVDSKLKDIKKDFESAYWKK